MSVFCLTFSFPANLFDKSLCCSVVLDEQLLQLKLVLWLALDEGTLGHDLSIILWTHGLLVVVNGFLSCVFGIYNRNIFAVTFGY